MSHNINSTKSKFQQKKILVIKTRAIGDTVIWTSALAKLRKAYPEAEIHALTSKMNKDILLHSQCINKLHLVDADSKWALIKKFYSLRQEKFDLLLGFHVSGTICKFSWLVGTKETALHYHGMDQVPWASTFKVPHHGQLEDAITRDYRVLQAIGIDADVITNAVSSEHEPTRIDLLAEELSFAKSLADQTILTAGGRPEQKRMIFLPGASYSLKIYPKDLWLKFILKVQAEGIYQPLVLCDPKLSKEWELPELLMEKKIPLIDSVSLRQFIALVSTGDMSLSNDSSPGHISVAVGVRTHFLFGPTCIGDWFCYDKTQHSFSRIAVDCRIDGPRDQDQFQFCKVTECAHQSCMRNLRVEGFLPIPS